MSDEPHSKSEMRRQLVTEVNEGVEEKFATGAINPYQDIEDILCNFALQFADTGLANHATFEDIKQFVREFVRQNLKLIWMGKGTSVPLLRKDDE